MQTNSDTLFKSIREIAEQIVNDGMSAADKEKNRSMIEKLVDYMASQEEFRDLLNSVLSEAYRNLTTRSAHDKELWEWFVVRYPRLFTLGVTKEFFSLFGSTVTNSYFNNNEKCERLFSVNEHGLAVFSYLPAFYRKSKVENKIKESVFKTTLNHLLEKYYVTGQILAHALLSGHVVGLNLAPYIVNILLGNNKNPLRDYKETEKDFYQSVDKLSNEEMIHLETPLILDIEHPFTAGKVEQFPLVSKSSGRSENDIATSAKGYLTMVARTKLYTLCKDELDNLKAGWDSVFTRFNTKFHPRDLLSAHEICRALCGAKTLNVEEWERSSVFYEQGNEYTDSPVVESHRDMFWQCVISLSDEDKLNLLQFVTGLCALPPAGFNYLPGGA
eukprot:sb/3465574/